MIILFSEKKNIYIYHKTQIKNNWVKQISKVAINYFAGLKKEKKKASLDFSNDLVDNSDTTSFQSK